MIVPSLPLGFEEPDVLTAAPACLAIIAAARCHWRLGNDEHNNYQDVTTGLPNLADYVTADPAKCRRYITFRFAQREQVVEGEKMGVDGFVQRMLEDPAFMRAAYAHPKHEGWWNVLRTECPKIPRRFAPTLHEKYGRYFVMPGWGADPVLFKKLTAAYEQPWT